MIERLLLNGSVAVIAHRGGSKLRPENTIAAFDHAVALGVDGVECDVHLSSDGVPVVIHDATLERTTNAAGRVSVLSADALGGIDAGHHFGEALGYPYRGKGLGVPRLEHLLRRHPQVPFVIEVKGDDPATAARVIDVVRSTGAGQRVMIGGFSQTILAAVRQAAPDLPTSASRDELKAAIRRSWFLLPPRRAGFAVIQAPYRFQGRRVFGRGFVRAVRRWGLPFHAWIIDEPSDMESLVRWGVTGLISDRPDLAVRTRDGLR